MLSINLVGSSTKETLKKYSGLIFPKRLFVSLIHSDSHKAAYGKVSVTDFVDIKFVSAESILLYPQGGKIQSTS